jgi:hypothetical protein
MSADFPAPHPGNPDEETLEELRHAVRAKLARLSGKPEPPPISQYPRTASAVDLLAAALPEPQWAVRGLLPQGAAILAGKPKVGKSWLSLELALAIAGDRPALADPTLLPSPGPVLYLALEDTAYRLQSRLRAALGDAAPPAPLRFTTRWPRFPEGLRALSAWLMDNPSARLVIVDTIAKVRSLQAQTANAYAEDYETIGALKAIADRHKITVLIVHHLRKAAIDDPLDAISGSAGLTGAADTILVLTRRRGAAAARLFVTGRDLDESELTLIWRADPAGWLASPDDAADLPPWFNDILRALRTAPDGLTPAELAAATERTPNACRVALFRLAQLGRVTKSNGKYLPADATPQLPPPPAPPPRSGGGEPTVTASSPVTDALSRPGSELEETPDSGTPLPRSGGGAGGGGRHAGGGGRQAA